MSNYYNLDGIKTEIKKRISEHKTLLQAWENVTFPTKKDGTPFKIMSKNFENAKFYNDITAWHDYEKKLKVNAFDELNGYISEDIYCYNQVKYIKDETMLAKTENIMPKEPMLEQMYVYDLDDIKNAIKEKIAYHKESIDSLENQLENADAAYNKFKEAYTNAIKELENIAGETTCLSYAIKGTITKRYPYC